MGDVIRYCKKCGAELPTDYRHKKCEFCRHENAGFWRKAGEAVLVGVGLVIAVGTAVAQHNSDNDSADSENDNDEV